MRDDPWEEPISAGQEERKATARASQPSRPDRLSPAFTLRACHSPPLDSPPRTSHHARFPKSETVDSRPNCDLIGADRAVLASLTPGAVDRWVSDQRAASLVEDVIASRLSALKVFSRKYVYQHLELTTGDLLRKVPRIIPPERPIPALSEGEQERLLACFDKDTYEEFRNRALIATYLATGLRFREVLELELARLDRLSGFGRTASRWATGVVSRSSVACASEAAGMISTPTSCGTPSLGESLSRVPSGRPCRTCSDTVPTRCPGATRAT